MNAERLDNLILVTGATGNVGREVIAALAGRPGVRVRAAVFSEAGAEQVPVEADETVRFNFGDPATYRPAFAGATRLFLMRPPAIADVNRFIKPAVDQAAAAGVGHIVFLSLLGVERNPLVPHARIEALLRESGVAWTMLRCGFFMQNLDTTHRADIVEHDDLFIPAGQGRTAFIDTRDIGAVAALALAGPGHEGQVYRLTGSESLTYTEVAAIMTEVLGRPITYSNPSPLDFARRMRGRGHPWGYISVMEGVYLTTRLGMAATVHPDTAELLGRPPVALRQYVADYAASFRV